MLLIVTEIPKGPSIIRDLDHGNKIWIAEMRLPVRREYIKHLPHALANFCSFRAASIQHLKIDWRFEEFHVFIWCRHLLNDLSGHSRCRPLLNDLSGHSRQLLNGHWPLVIQRARHNMDTWNSLNRQSIFRCCNWLTVSVNFQMLYWRCLEGAEEILNNWKANWWTPAILYLFTKKKNNCLCSEFDILYMQYREPIWSGGRHDCFYNWFYV